MEIQTRENLTKQTSDLLCVFRFENATLIENQNLITQILHKKILLACADYKFKGLSGETLIIEGGKPFSRILIIGLGKKKLFDAEVARLTAYTAIKKANSLRVSSMTLVSPDSRRHLGGFFEGIWYGEYQFKPLKKKIDPNTINTLQKTTVVSKATAAKALSKEVSIIFEAVSMARDLVNLPANIVTPSYLEKKAKAIVKGQTKTNIEILTELDARKLNMGAFLSVTKGSVEPAKMIVMEYRGDPKRKTVYGIIGKGITFDSGGLSLKSAAGMMTMKLDMAGGAAALGVFKAVLALNLRINLIVIIAATENMPGGNASRPGDIITASNGKTIEILNTDAEGRLVLADALVYAQKRGATRLIDIATLTGAAVTTFGGIHTALMSNNQTWTDAYLTASLKSGEKTWQLPMDADYDELVKSDIADVANMTKGGKAGSIGGAKLLEKFVDPKTAWIHLDIAGTSYLDAPRGYLEKAATGTPIRTIIEVLKHE